MEASKSYGSQDTLPADLPASKVKQIEHDRQCRMQTKKTCKSPSYWSPKCKCMTGIRKPRTKKIKEEEKENKKSPTDKSPSNGAIKRMLKSRSRKVNPNLPSILRPNSKRRKEVMRRLAKRRLAKGSKGLILSVPRVSVNQSADSSDSESSSDDEPTSYDNDFLAAEDEDKDVNQELDALLKVFGKAKAKSNYKGLGKTNSPVNESLEKLIKEKRDVQKELQKITDDYMDLLDMERDKEVEIQKKMGVKGKALNNIEPPNKKELTESYNRKVYEFKLKHPKHFENPKLKKAS